MAGYSIPRDSTRFEANAGSTRVAPRVAQPSSTIDRGYDVVANGLVVARELTFEEWCACGAALVHVASRTAWAIGDWLVYGAGRGDYGEFYDEARRITGRSFETLSQYARASQQYPAAQRGIRVAWSFYREALRLPETDRMSALEIARDNQWTRDGLAAYISTRDGATPSVAKTISVIEASGKTRGRPRGSAKGWQPTSHHRVVQCPSCGFAFEPKARKRTRVSS